MKSSLSQPGELKRKPSTNTSTASHSVHDMHIPRIKLDVNVHVFICPLLSILKTNGSYFTLASLTCGEIVPTCSRLFVFSRPKYGLQCIRAQARLKDVRLTEASDFITWHILHKRCLMNQTMKPFTNFYLRVCYFITTDAECANSRSSFTSCVRTVHMLVREGLVCCSIPSNENSLHTA